MNYLTIHANYVLAKVAVVEAKIEAKAERTHRINSYSGKIMQILQDGKGLTTAEIARLIDKSPKDTGGIMSHLRTSKLITKKKNHLGQNVWSAVNAPRADT